MLCQKGVPRLVTGYGASGRNFTDLGARRNRANAIRDVTSLSKGSVANPLRITLSRIVCPVARRKAVTASGPASDTPFQRYVVMGALKIAVTIPSASPQSIVGIGRRKNPIFIVKWVNVAIAMAVKAYAQSVGTYKEPMSTERTPTTVSYTHLDVYKRQRPICGVSAIIWRCNGGSRPKLGNCIRIPLTLSNAASLVFIQAAQTSLELT